MKSLLNTQIMLSIHLLIVVAVIVVGSWMFSNSKSDLRAEIDGRIDRQVVLLKNLAELTDRNGADEVVSEIIVDCPTRSKFETLLNQLGVLNHRDLISAQQLFESCGGFYAERKAVMVSRLQREYEVLVENINLLTILNPDNTLMNDMGESWGSIVTLELERSALLAEQVVIQRDIITELIGGANVNSTVIVSKTSRAQDVSELLAVTDSKIDALREAVGGE